MNGFLDLSEAIDRAGPVLFGGDWIGSLTEADVAILKKYGPLPHGQARQSIARCPEKWSRRLDRVLGRDVRMVIQRATVLDWIFAAKVGRGGLLTFELRCDPVLLDRLVARARGGRIGRGAPPLAQLRVIRAMLADLHSGATTPERLRREKELALSKLYGASRSACKKARLAALSEWRRTALPN
jgi:hypothetical protein